VKVNIIGKGSGWEDAPASGESWGITQLILRRPVNLVIDMNVYEDGRWGGAERIEADKVKSLCLDQCIPFIGLDNYPLNQVMDRFGTDYFSNTVDYAIALALFRGYDDIDLYGVNMAHQTEYIYQKAGVEYWVGRAHGMGCTVTVHGNLSTILKTQDGFLYGYDIPQRWRLGQDMATEKKRSKKIQAHVVETFPSSDFRFDDVFKPYTVACMNCRTYYDVIEEDRLLMCPKCGSMSYREV